MSDMNTDWELVLTALIVAVDEQFSGFLIEANGFTTMNAYFDDHLLSPLVLC
jgi:hypothetical protein